MAAETGTGAPRLLGRRAECEALDRLLTDALGGQSRVTVLRGEAGVGKSALLRYLSDRVAGWRVATAVGVESEMELAYSGLHQLCAPLLGHLERLPTPQRDALATVFGMSAGPAPDRFMVGLATLTLLAETAEEQPLACIVDDAHWLDHASAEIFAFVARRLLAERIALVCAARTGVGDHVLAGLPELPIHGLADGEARALLLDNVQGPLDAAVSDRMIAESHGNPLALLELPRTRRAADLAGGFGLPDSQPVAGKIEQGYVRRLLQFPSDTHVLVLTAAAEPLGDPVLLHRAAQTLGLDMAAADPAVDAGLLEVSGRVEFAHPLVRSAAYRSGSADDRRRVHRALADATDAETDPDRRAWHRGRATTGPDEDVAAELERSCGPGAGSRWGRRRCCVPAARGRADGGPARRRAERALAAAQASLQAGAFDAALGLLATAEAEPLDEFQRARVDLLRGHVAFASVLGSDAPPLLLKAASTARAVRCGARARDLPGRVGRGGDAGAQGGHHPGGLAAPSGPFLRDRVPRVPSTCCSTASLCWPPTDTVPRLRRCSERRKHSPTSPWRTSCGGAGWLSPPATSRGTIEGMHAISARQVQLVRDAGALAQLPLHLSLVGHSNRAWTGDFAGAASLVAEVDSVAAATGSRFAPHAAHAAPGTAGKGSRGLRADSERYRASRGRRARAGGDRGALGSRGPVQRPRPLRGGSVRGPASRLEHLRAVDNQLWALPELVEAAARDGDAELARDALERLAETTQPCRHRLRLGIEARSPGAAE